MALADIDPKYVSQVCFKICRDFYQISQKYYNF